MFEGETAYLIEKSRHSHAAALARAALVADLAEEPGPLTSSHLSGRLLRLRSDILGAMRSRNIVSLRNLSVDLAALGLRLRLQTDEAERSPK
jgi:hypothetical protein